MSQRENAIGALFAVLGQLSLGTTVTLAFLESVASGLAFIAESAVLAKRVIAQPFDSLSVVGKDIETWFKTEVLKSAKNYGFNAQAVDAEIAKLQAARDDYVRAANDRLFNINQNPGYVDRVQKFFDEQRRTVRVMGQKFVLDTEAQAKEVQAIYDKLLPTLPRKPRPALDLSGFEKPKPAEKLNEGEAFLNQLRSRLTRTQDGEAAELRARALQIEAKGYKGAAMPIPWKSSPVWKWSWSSATKTPPQKSSSTWLTPTGTWFASRKLANPCLTRYAPAARPSASRCDRSAPCPIPPYRRPFRRPTPTSPRTPSSCTPWSCATRIAVAYVAEQFENDGSPVSTIVKGVKRAMAGEYSRELSAKVFAGQCRLIEMGFRQGGSAGFGLRRVLIDQSGQVKGELKRGEHKSLQTDRVILMPGPDSEVATVNQIYRWLVEGDLPLAEIVKRLNDQPIYTDQDRPWTYSTVRQVLTNEKYIGNNVYNRHSFKLKKKHVDNPPEMWIRKEGAFDGIVPVATFMAAQEILAERSKKLTDAELLDHLKALYAECGRLSGFIIDQAPVLPSAATYIQRFGSLTRAYELVGYHCPRSTEFLEINRRLRQLHPEIVSRTEHTIAELGGHISRDPKTDLLTLNDELVISLVLARCQTAANGHQRWRIRFDPARFDPDITVAIRLDAANAQELDYYLLPRLDLPDQEIRVSNKNSADFECFRFDDLNFFYGMSERERLQRRV